MRFTHIKLTNWKNFRSAEVSLPQRAFLIGPNASGKSNFLDAFRFLRDLALPSGGLQHACDQRGGVTKIRSLAARNPSHLEIDINLIGNDQEQWRYLLQFSQETRFPRPGMALIKQEKVMLNGEILLSRPNKQDELDEALLSQTALEQTSMNRAFRALSEYFANITYLHLVPQMIRDTSGWSRDSHLTDIYGGRFLEMINKTPEKTRNRRLKRIEDVLKLAVPQLSALNLKLDERGTPHLEATYEHWRPNAGRQNESQFSDGTIRLIGLLWVLQEGSGLLLLEEPELSLHQGIVRRLAPFIARMQIRQKGDSRQAFISTHSVDLLSDEGIGPGELLVFSPEKQGTVIQSGLEIDTIRQMMETGLLASEVALPYTDRESFQQLGLFDL
ncbi:MAG: AAA family ATPase [Anaerolineae bacterium]|nr:AAA family ATPase [Anaerolineae bacterium]